jgi:hypothetical protein
MRNISFPLAATFITVLLVMQGCASSQNQALKRQEMSSLAPIKVVRHETPGIMKSSGAETGLLALVTLAAPGGAALLVVGDSYGKARGSETQSIIPDFGALVMDRFVENARQSVPDLPQLTPVREPVKEEDASKTAVIELDVKRLAYGSIDLTRGGIVLERGLDKGVIADGFLSKTVATMKDPHGEVLWQKTYLYLSKDHDRGMSADELEADSCMLLKEEMQYAAEKTVQDFVSHLNSREN